MFFHGYKYIHIHTNTTYVYIFMNLQGRNPPFMNKIIKIQLPNYDLIRGLEVVTSDVMLIKLESDI